MGFLSFMAHRIGGIFLLLLGVFFLIFNMGHNFLLIVGLLALVASAYFLNSKH